MREALERARLGSVAVLERKRDYPQMTELMLELTELLPDGTWVQTLNYRDGAVDLRGESTQATALIGLLERGAGINNVTFRSPVMQSTPVAASVSISPLTIVRRRRHEQRSQPCLYPRSAATPGLYRGLIGARPVTARAGDGHRPDLAGADADPGTRHPRRSWIGCNATNGSSPPCPALRQALADEQSNDAFKAYYFDADTPAIAGAQLQSEVQDMVRSAGARPVSAQVLPSNEQDDPPRVRVRIQLQGTTEQLFDVLYRVESARPFLLIDQLSIRSQARSNQRRGRTARGTPRPDNQDQLTVRLDIFGYFLGSTG